MASKDHLIEQLYRAQDRAINAHGYRFDLVPGATVIMRAPSRLTKGGTVVEAKRVAETRKTQG